jgi:hypothetical protein
MTDSPTRGLSTAGDTWHWSSTTTTRTDIQGSRTGTLLILRLEQACADRRRHQGPTAAAAVALRAILDPDAYLDAPTSRRTTSKKKIKSNNGG